MAAGTPTPRLRKLLSYRDWLSLFESKTTGAKVSADRRKGVRAESLFAISLEDRAPLSSGWTGASSPRAADELAAEKLYHLLIIEWEEARAFLKKYAVEKPVPKPEPIRFPYDAEAETQILRDEGENIVRNYRTWLNNFCQSSQSDCRVDYLRVRDSTYVATATFGSGFSLATDTETSIQRAGRSLYFQLLLFAEARSHYEKVGPPLALDKPEYPRQNISIAGPESDSEVAARIEQVRHSAPAGVEITRLSSRPRSRVYRVYYRARSPETEARAAHWRDQLKAQRIQIVLIPEQSWLERTGIERTTLRDYVMRDPGDVVGFLGQRRRVRLTPSPLPPSLKLYADRRSRDTFSIDPPDSPDIDDAISIGERPERPLPPGQTWVGIHIAAVSDFVPCRSDVERNAIAQGEAMYGRVYVKPIFPREIALDLASLHASVERLAYTIFLRLDENDQIAEIDFQPERSLIQNRRRYLYGEVEEILQGKQIDFREIIFRRLARATGHLHQIRMGNQNDTNRKSRLTSQNIVTELMILANSVTAFFLDSRQVPYFRLVNPKPADVESDLFETKFATWIQQALSSDSELPRPTSIESPATEREFGRRSSYSTTEAGHWNLQTPVYGHFTSPLRRATDYVNQKQLASAIDISEPRSAAELKGLEPVLTQSILRARRAKFSRMIALEQLSRSLEKVGHWRRVTISSIKRGEVEFYGDRYFPSGYLEPTVVWNNDAGFLEPSVAWSVSNETESFTDQKGNTYRPGDTIDVILSGIDIERESLIFTIP